VALCVALGLAAPAALAAPRVDVCWDYGCDRQATVEIPGPAWQRIRSLFAPPAADPAGERARIARAIALFETATGRVIGTEADLGGNRAGSGREFQMDCIDESRNTDRYLRVLEDHALLHWHEVAERRKRAPWILDQHWTAVVREPDSGSAWAIDSWFLDNGRQPYVQPLEAWLDKEDLPPNPDAPGHDS
jgi:hypothetical protein